MAQSTLKLEATQLVQTAITIMDSVRLIKVITQK